MSAFRAIAAYTALCLLAFFVCILAATGVLADTAVSGNAVQPTQVIDFSPIISQVILAIGAVFAALATWATRWVINKIKSSTSLDLTQQEHIIRGYVTSAIDNAVLAAIEKTTSLDWTKLSTRNELVATAVNHIINAVPDGLKALGIGDRDTLENIVLSRLSKYDTSVGTWDDDDQEQLPLGNTLNNENRPA